MSEDRKADGIVEVHVFDKEGAPSISCKIEGKGKYIITALAAAISELSRSQGLPPQFVGMSLGAAAAELRKQDCVSVDLGAITKGWGRDE